jgi:hypothetical protein
VRNHWLPRLFDLIVTTGVAAVAGCASSDPPPPQSDPPIRVLHSGPGTQAIDLPMPDPAPTVPPVGFDDPAIVTQEMPEEPAFVARYNAVGSPRILVFVNRDLTGMQMPVAPGGTVHYPDGSSVYSPTGTTDSEGARAIDYELIESIMSSDLSAGGRVTMVSPVAARGRLSDAEFADLRSGRPQMLGEIARKLQCDVLVRVTAKPSIQSGAVRLVAEAMNVQGGQQLAQSAVDVPPPLVKTTLNNYCRFVTRQLMAGMTAQWARIPVSAAQTPPPMVLPQIQPPTVASPSTAVSTTAPAMTSRAGIDASIQKNPPPLPATTEPTDPP